MIEFFSFLIFMILFFVLVFKNFQTNLKLSLLSKEVIKLNVDNFILSEELSKIANTPLQEPDNTSEAFLKFISDSRDWAYQYIDDVQESLNKFIIDIEPEIAYFDEYGIAGSAYPHYHSMKKISGAYKELKKLLPEDYDRIE
jgi:hypothetical protein